MPRSEIVVGKDLAQRFISSILSSLRRYIDAEIYSSVKDELLDMAKRGVLPKPDELFSKGEPQWVLASAFAHREFGRLLASAVISSGKLATEALGAYIESLSLMLLLQISGLVDIEDEIARTLFELSMISKKVGDKVTAVDAIRALIDRMLEYNEKLRG